MRAKNGTRWGSRHQQPGGGRVRRTSRVPVFFFPVIFYFLRGAARVICSKQKGLRHAQYGTPAIHGDRQHMKIPRSDNQEKERDLMAYSRWGHIQQSRCQPMLAPCPFGVTARWLSFSRSLAGRLITATDESRHRDCDARRGNANNQANGKRHPSSTLT